MISNRQLFSKIVAFNRDVNELPDDLVAESVNDVEKILKDKDPSLHIFKKKLSFFHTFEDPGLRLAFADKSEITTLCLYLGACSYTPYLSSRVMKSERQEIIEHLGSSVYDFVMTLGRFLIDKSMMTDFYSSFELSDACIRRGAAVINLYLDTLGEKQTAEFIRKTISSLSPDTSINDAHITPERLNKLISIILINEIDKKWKDYLS
ncbi:MAG: hypothetical protein ACI4NE_05755 [Succinivibrio sp.]